MSDELYDDEVLKDRGVEGVRAVGDSDGFALRQSGRTGGNDPLRALFSTNEVAKLIGVKASRLRYWRRTNLLRPSARLAHKPYYTFQDLVSIRAANSLLDRGLTMTQVRDALDSLRETPSDNPLSTRKLRAEGGRVIVDEDGGSFDASTGQTLINFTLESVHAEVIEFLAGGRRSRARAYELYLKACRLDEDEETLDEAEALYHQAIALDPSLSNALTNLGNLHYRRDQIHEAERFYQRALQIDPEQPEAHYDLGLIYFERGDLLAAIEAFRIALTNDASFADAHFNLAMALEEIAHSTEARRHWQEYLRLEPVGAWSSIAREHLEHYAGSPN
ncbi:MAG: tetratricopeptide repeat protein [Polyangiales bacterium]